MKYLFILLFLISCSVKPKEESFVLPNDIRPIEKCTIVNDNFIDTLFFKIVRNNKPDIEFKCLGFYEDGQYYYFLKSTFNHRILKSDVELFHYVKGVKNENLGKY